jgi:hypothetical protein
MLDVPTGHDSGPVNVTIDARHTMSPGVYCYVLWVHDSLGRHVPQPMTKIVTITVKEAQAAFTAPEKSYGSVSVNDASDPGESEIVDWKWDFGDPGSPGDVSSGRTSGHTYEAPETYTITLTITDHLGRTSSATRQVLIEQYPGG